LRLFYDKLRRKTTKKGAKDMTNQTATKKIRKAMKRDIESLGTEDAKALWYGKFSHAVNKICLPFTGKQTHYTEDSPETYTGTETEVLNHSVESYGSKAFRLEPLFKPEKGELEKLAEFAKSLFPDEVQEIKSFLKIVYGADFLSSAYQILSSAKRKKQSLKKVNSYLQELTALLSTPVEREVIVRGEKETVSVSAIPCSHLAGMVEAPELPYFSDFIEESETGFIPDAEIAELPTPKPALKSAAQADGLKRIKLGYDDKEKEIICNRVFNFVAEGKKPTDDNICRQWARIGSWEELTKARLSLPEDKKLRNFFFNKFYPKKKELIIKNQLKSNSDFQRIDTFLDKVLEVGKVTPTTRENFKKVKGLIKDLKPPQPLSSIFWDKSQKINKLL
jgi:hypothetical protein